MATAQPINADNPLRRVTVAAVTPRALLAVVFAYLSLGHLLLGAFLGLSATGITAMAIVASVLVTAIASARCPAAEPRIGWSALFGCWAVAAVLLVLSGEGRLFYANVDWQVRQAVLGDMGRNPWPFVYSQGGESWLLRAPLGMYFVPALVWQWAGERAAGFAMLAQNSMLIGTLLAAVSPTLPDRRARLIALAAFIVFSGLDAAGSLGRPLEKWDHLEYWNDGLQYSSTMTLLFWVPQHAIAGWAGAAAYLLWRCGLAPARVFLAVVPLVSLWSPLAMIGLLPFAAHVGLALLPRLRWTDVAVPALAVLLVVPALIYLGADPGGAPFKLVPLPLSRWLFCQALETLPYLGPLWLAVANRRAAEGSLGTMITVTGALLVFPLLGIGESTDLMMRGSIPALAILAWMVSREVTRPGSDWSKPLMVILAIGAITPAFEIARSLRHPAAPAVRCTMFEAWDLGPTLYGSDIYSKGTYLARLDRVPAAISPNDPVRIAAYPGQRCWDGYWFNPMVARPRPQSMPAVDAGNASLLEGRH